MKPKELKENIMCTGCGACANICIQNAIHMDYDDEGFLKPFIVDSLCVNCDACVKICPALEQLSFNENMSYVQECYALWASDDILMKSSSGGFFSVAANYILDNKGMVFGAAYDDEFAVEMRGITLKNDIDKLRRSKYVQSNTKFTFRQVKGALLDNKRVIYFGLPCQIHGLKNYLKDVDTTNLIAVDLLCAGVPPQKYFDMYLEQNHKKNEIKDIIFRDKKTRGWSSCGFRIEHKDGSETILTYDYKKDSYLDLFLQRLFRNDACENCKYCRTERLGDITIGDFWGIDLFTEKYNRNGTSFCLVNSSKGRSFLEEIKSLFDEVHNVPIEWSFCAGNRINQNCHQGNPQRYYFKKLIRKESFNLAVKHAIDGFHEIGLVVCINHNIGNNLTNYALYRYLKSLDYEVLLISPPNSSIIVSNNPFDKFDLFDYFPFDSYDIEPEHNNKFEMVHLNDKCDVFIVGSDQLFRKTFIDASDYYSLLDWVKASRRKISYATSLGIDYFEGDKSQTETVEKLLKRFDDISVREASGVDVLKQSFNVDAVHTIDPIFLLDKSYYFEMAEKGRGRIPAENYVACYILDESYLKKEIIENVSHSLTKGNYIAILDTETNYEGISDYLEALSKPKNEEWISMINNCEILITDSFHATCMAIILHKPFITVSDPNFTRGFARVVDILKMVRLEERIVTTVKDIQQKKLLAKSIDFKKVDEYLQPFINYSKSWLEGVLNKEKTLSRASDSYDSCYEVGTYIQLKNDQKLGDVCTHYNNILEKHFWELKKARSDAFFASQISIKDKQIISKGSENMQIVIWGAGNNFKRNIEKIKKIRNIKYVCDNAPEKWGKEFDGVICISPEQLRQMSDVFVVIAIDDGGITLDIAKTLLNIGISRFDHIHNWLRSVEV